MQGEGMWGVTVDTDPSAVSPQWLRDAADLVRGVGKGKGGCGAAEAQHHRTTSADASAKAAALLQGLVVLQKLAVRDGGERRRAVIESGALPHLFLLFSEGSHAGAAQREAAAQGRINGGGAGGGKNRDEAADADGREHDGKDAEVQEAVVALLDTLLTPRLPHFMAARDRDAFGGDNDPADEEMAESLRTDDAACLQTLLETLDPASLVAPLTCPVPPSSSSQKHHQQQQQERRRQLAMRLVRELIRYDPRRREAVLRRCLLPALARCCCGGSGAAIASSSSSSSPSPHSPTFLLPPLPLLPPATTLEKIMHVTLPLVDASCSVWVIREAMPAMLAACGDPSALQRKRKPTAPRKKQKAKKGRAAAGGAGGSENSEETEDEDARRTRVTCYTLTFMRGLLTAPKYPAGVSSSSTHANDISSAAAAAAAADGARAALEAGALPVLLPLLRAKSIEVVEGALRVLTVIAEKSNGIPATPSAHDNDNNDVAATTTTILDQMLSAGLLPQACYAAGASAVRTAFLRDLLLSLFAGGPPSGRARVELLSTHATELLTVLVPSPFFSASSSSSPSLLFSSPSAQPRGERSDCTGDNSDGNADVGEEEETSEQSRERPRRGAARLIRILSESRPLGLVLLRCGALAALAECRMRCTGTGSGGNAPSCGGGGGGEDWSLTAEGLREVDAAIDALLSFNGSNNNSNAVGDAADRGEENATRTRSEEEEEAVRDALPGLLDLYSVNTPPPTDGSNSNTSPAVQALSVPSVVLRCLRGLAAAAPVLVTEELARRGLPPLPA